MYAYFLTDVESNKKWNDTEKPKNINFQLYYNMMKSNKMTWELFIQIMDDMISLLDLAKSKKLIFDLIQEIKEFKEKEAEYKAKLQLNRVSELELSNDILRRENVSLKNELDELKGKVTPFFDQKGNHVDFSSNSNSLHISDDKNFETKIVL